MTKPQHREDTHTSRSVSGKRKLLVVNNNNNNHNVDQKAFGFLINLTDACCEFCTLRFGRVQCFEMKKDGKNEFHTGKWKTPKCRSHFALVRHKSAANEK